MFSSADEIRLVKMFSKQGGACGLCDHQPITYHFVLVNEKTKASIIVGSRCVHNIKDVLRKNGKRVEIVCSVEFKNSARKLNEKFPDLVRVEEELVEEYYDDFPDPDESEDTDLTIEDSVPEGLGDDEIDWDSWDGEGPDN